MSNIFEEMKNELLEKSERERLDELTSKYSGVGEPDYDNMSLREELQIRMDLQNLAELKKKYGTTAKFGEDDLRQGEYGRKTAKQLDSYLENYTTPKWPDYFGPLAPVIDFGRNYYEMFTKNLNPSDKFFHCKANYEATNRGGFGETIAENLGNLREWVDQNIKGDSISSSIADQRANYKGRLGAKMGKTLKETCPTFYKDYEEEDIE